MRKARRELGGRVGHVVGELLDQVPARGERVEAERATRASRDVGNPRRAPRWIDKDTELLALGASEAQHGGDLLGIADLDPRGAPRAQVHRRDGRGRGIAVIGPHIELRCGEGSGVRANPAAEIMDLGDPGCRIPAGSSCSDPRVRGLFDPVEGEQHPVRARPELRPSLGPPLRLRERGRDQLGIEAVRAQPTSQREGFGLVIGREGLEQSPALTGGETSDEVWVHAAHLRSLRR